MSKDDLKAKAISALRRHQKLPDVVRGFFHDPHLSYTLELPQEISRESTNLYSC